MSFDRKNAGHLLVGVVLSLAAGACSNGKVGPVPVADRCQQRPDQEVKVEAGVQAGFQQGIVKFEGSAGYDQLVSVKNRFDTLQSDFAQMSYQLCEDRATNAVSQQYYERRRECLDNALIAMRAMGDVLSQNSEAPPKELAWEVEAKAAMLQEILTCPKEGSAVYKAPEDPEQQITLTAYLICQKKRGGKFVDVPECTETALRENDRVKIGFKADKDARFYVLNYNDTGLFQTIFPDKGIANEIEAGREYILPPDFWLELDDQKGVVEHLQVIAAIDKIPQLEDLRGAYFEPKAQPGSNKPKRQPKKAVRTRGFLEPVITRGFKQKGKKPIKLDVGESEPVETVPMVAKKPGVNVIEFKLIHE